MRHIKVFCGKCKYHHAEKYLNFPWVMDHSCMHPSNEDFEETPVKFKILHPGCWQANKDNKCELYKPNIFVRLERILEKMSEWLRDN